MCGQGDDLRARPSFGPWPRRSDTSAPAPPCVTPELVRAVQEQDRGSLPDRPYPPALAAFVASLEEWRVRLAEHFALSSSCYAANTRAAAQRIRRRLACIDPDRRCRIMRVVTQGYRIPLSSAPPAFHRAHNSPDLLAHTAEAWAAIRKDMSHGAIVPCDLRQGAPHVVSPVRTAPKGWRTGKRRFVVNMRYINRFVPESASTCSLETLSRIRGLLEFPPQESPVSWFISMDLASGYHNFWVCKEQWHLMGFALHVSELPDEAVSFLRQNYPHCERAATGLFYFTMRALPFGLAPSCAVFSDVITALASAWRRHRVATWPVRITSYIDDFLSVSRCVPSRIACLDRVSRARRLKTQPHAFRTARAALITAIELVYEATACGLTINVAKCRLGPATRVRYLGLIIDSRSHEFRVPAARAERVTFQVRELSNLVHANPTGGRLVPARSIDSLVGLLWALSPCCPRGVAMCARGMIACLTDAMAASVWCSGPALSARAAAPGAPWSSALRRVLAHFWSGSVSWSAAADRDLAFWRNINFSSLRFAPRFLLA